MKILLTKKNIKRFMLFAVILFLFSNVYIDFVHIKDILKYFKIF